ncbi:MAG: sulfatase, partial [Planctomycetales bacterium]|nr:sulfatase [Planctomycetales bacterium]
TSAHETAEPAEPGAGAVRRPNFLFLITDDQRWDALGAVQRAQGDRARWPWLQTPNLDRLAAGGARFSNAFVVHSLCSPSRAAFLSGQYGHLCGVTDNSTHFPADAVNVAALLSGAGYRTGYVGKYHMAFQPDRPGFQYVASYTSQGEYFGSTFLIEGRPVKSNVWVDDAATDYALEFIRDSRHEPWFLVVGFKSPHTPRQPPRRADERFAGRSVRIAANADATPSYGKGQRAFKGEEVGRPVETDADSSGSDPYLLDYFESIAAVDDNVGRVLDLLDELQQAEDTVVVFAGDNGYYLGEHGLGDKRSAYEESMRIPLLMRYPRKVPRETVIDAMALNIDMAPTFLDLASLAIPDAMQGASWMPLVFGDASNWRKAFMFEYFFESGLPATPAMLALRTPTAKLIVYPGHEEWTELFDLAADPYELANLAKTPERRGLLESLRRQLEEQKQRFGDPFASAAVRD